MSSLIVNINKFAGIVLDWVGLFMCFSGVIPFGGKHINKPHPPPKIPGQSRENVVYSAEPKVRLQGYGYNPFCSHSSRCLAVLA